MTNQENYIAIDLEMNQPSQTIIQTGITIGNIKTEQILLKRKWYIKCNETLNPFIINLTGIKQSDVDNGIPLIDCYNQIVELSKQYNCFINPITWGGGDSEKLRKDLGLEDGRFIFGRRWIDAKTLYVCWRTSLDKPRQGGLAKALTVMGMKFEGRKHDAADDSLNSMRIYFALQRKWRA